MLIRLFQGFCMALADSVPGVSGGTIALILGFYERFIGALHSLFGKDREARKPALFYLINLGIGWAVGLLASMLALAQLFEKNIYFLSSLFLGLTISSIPFVVKEEKASICGRLKNLPFLFIGILFVCGLTAFRAASADSTTLNYLHLSALQYGYLFLSGALAIMAMILPGVSGSTLLLIMGTYIPTIKAVHALLHLEWSVLPGILALGFGILVGAVISVRFIRSALRKHRSQMVYLILGLMIGSLAAIVMGPTTLPAPQLPLSLSTFQPLAFLIGIIILVALECLKKLTFQREHINGKKFMGPEASDKT